MNFKSFINTNNIFLICSLSVFVIVSILILLFGGTACFIAINSNYTSAEDISMPIITMLGEIYLILPMCLFFLLRNIKLGLGLIISYALSAIIVQVIKHGLTIENLRPILYFEKYSSYKVHLIANYINNYHHSFPSGHSATAFSIFGYVAYSLKNNTQKILCLILAMLVAYSRIYMGQHFIEDTIGGAIIGLGSATLIYHYFFNNSFINTPLLNKSFIH